MRFSCPECLRKCTRYEVADFSLSLDETVASHPEAKVIGYVSAISEQESNPLDLVLEEF